MCHPDVNRVLNTENMLSMNIVSTTGEGGKHQCDPGGGELVGGVLLTRTAPCIDLRCMHSHHLQPLQRETLDVSIDHIST